VHPQDFSQSPRRNNNNSTRETHPQDFSQSPRGNNNNSTRETDLQVHPQDFSQSPRRSDSSSVRKTDLQVHPQDFFQSPQEHGNMSAIETDKQVHPHDSYRADTVVIPQRVDTSSAYSSRLARDMSGTEAHNDGELGTQRAAMTHPTTTTRGSSSKKKAGQSRATRSTSAPTSTRGVPPPTSTRGVPAPTASRGLGVLIRNDNNEMIVEPKEYGRVTRDTNDSIYGCAVKRPTLFGEHWKEIPRAWQYRMVTFNLYIIYTRRRYHG